MERSLPIREGERQYGEVEEEEEEDVDETGYKAAKDAVLFAIDVSKSMLRKPSDDKKDRDSPTSAALKCAYQLMQQRIITNPKDMMGILLFGTEQSKFEQTTNDSTTFQYPHCYLLADLDRPEANDVKRLRTLVEDEEEADKLLVPSAEPVAMSNVLFCANQIFTTKAPNFSSRRLFLVTDNDNPHASSKDMRSSAVVRAKDLYDLGVVIELFPISGPDHDFDRTKFYDDIVYRPELSDPEAPAPVALAAKSSSSKDGLSLLQALVSSVMSRNANRRALFSNVPLEIGPDLRISVSGYIIFKRQEPARSCYCFQEGEKTVLVEGNTTRIEAGTSRTVEQQELRKAFKFGGETVTFTPEELTSIKNFGDPIIRILGFKPLSMLPLWANVRPSTFLYPSEEAYVGSTRTFSALYQSLLRKKKMAICWYIARKNAAPVVAALMPGEERKAKDGEHVGVQTVPPGLWLVRLPFADDIRKIPEKDDDRTIRAPDIMVDKMREIVQQLQLPKAQYDPFKYPNPALQWHYRVLQAMALDEDVPEKAVDVTVPKYRQIDKRAGPYVVEWGELLQKSKQEWEQSFTGRNNDAKRPGTSAGAPPAKKQKTSGDGLSEEEMRAKFEKQTLGSLSIPVLKQWAKDKGLRFSSTAKKADLVDLVEGYFETK